MNNRRQKEEAVQAIPMTPLIDCVFLLLIFFMVAAVFSVTPGLDFSVTPGLDVKLPEAERATTPEQQNLFIVIDKDGNMKLNHRTVTINNLKQMIEENRRKLDMTTTLIIQADKRTFHGVVVKVMDIAKKAGIVDNVIATEPTEEEEEIEEEITTE
jgi:biopolymer transport protein ExbD